MKALERLFDGLRPTFESGRLQRFRPLFEATVNFALSPGTQTDCAPHIRDPLGVKRYMSMVILALIPATMAGIYFFGLRFLVMALVSYAVGGTVEVIFACVRKEEINEGFLVTGLIFPLVLPPATPLWMVAVGVAAGVVIGKEIFGGTGRNPFNAALVGRAILTLGYPKAMSGWIAPASEWPGRLLQYVGPGDVDAVTAATPLALAKNTDIELTSAAQMFWGNVTGCVGETSAICIIAGGLFLVLVRVANWRSIVATLGTFALMGLGLRALAPERFGPVGWHMLAGGLLFGTIFMATDPVTSPITRAGKWAYGILIGVVVLLIRNLTGNVEGMTYAILLGNIAAPTMDEAVTRIRIRRLRREA